MGCALVVSTEEGQPQAIHDLTFGPREALFIVFDSKEES